MFKEDQNARLTLVAGNGRLGYSGDDGPATSAQLYDPRGVAVDSAGNVYIADAWNHRIRRVSGGGISTAAGTGTRGFSGDGGQAPSAQLDSPTGLALDGGGNLYIGFWNHRVRRVSASGIITTVAGTGVPGYSGDGGPATSAQLYFPFRIAADGTGSVYLGTYAYAVRKLTPVAACTTSATPTAFTAPASGGPLITLTIQAAAGCAWSITGLPSWVTASASSGSGPATLTLTVAQNTGTFRSAAITAAGTSVTINQMGTGGLCTYSINPTRQSLTVSGGTGSFNVSTAAGCAWTATSAAAWITITKGASGTGNGTVEFTVPQNPTPASSRVGTIAVAGLTFTVEQYGTSGPDVVAVGSMPQIASGGGWKTTITLVNNGTSCAMSRLTFTADDGSKLTLPVNFPQTPGGPGTSRDHGTRPRAGSDFYRRV